MMSQISNLKKKQRNEFSKIRKEINKKNLNSLNLQILNDLFNKQEFETSNVVSSFFSINNEIPTNNLNEYLLSRNKKLTFPVIKKGNKILTFKEFKKNQKLIKGYYNIPEPPSNNNELIPEVIFVPCLAFDTEGYRLGYGGGYYDRTFAYYKKFNHNFISVGFAYDDQKTSKVYTDSFDYKLHYVLTEKHLYSFI